MSLARGEQHALAAIATELSRSDPEFTATLALLARQLPPGRGPGRVLSWWPPRRSARAVPVIVLVIATVLLLTCCVAGAVAAVQRGHAAPRPGSGSAMTAPARYLPLPDSRRSSRGGRPIHPTSDDFRHSLRFRVTLRRFLRWSEEQAAEAGLTTAQHQLLVAVKGHPGPRPPAIREIAEYLLLQSHSAVGLVDRAEAACLVRRAPDPDDARVVRVELTEKGDKLVTELTTAHLARLYELAAALNDLLPPAGHADGGTG